MRKRWLSTPPFMNAFQSSTGEEELFLDTDGMYCPVLSCDHLCSINFYENSSGLLILSRRWCSESTWNNISPQSVRSVSPRAFAYLPEVVDPQYFTVRPTVKSNCCGSIHWEPSQKQTNIFSRVCIKTSDMYLDRPDLHHNFILVLWYTQTVWLSIKYMNRVHIPTYIHRLIPAGTQAACKLVLAFFDCQPKKIIIHIKKSSSFLFASAGLQQICWIVISYVRFFLFMRSMTPFVVVCHTSV